MFYNKAIAKQSGVPRQATMLVFTADGKLERTYSGPYIHPDSDGMKTSQSHTHEMERALACSDTSCVLFSLS